MPPSPQPPPADATAVVRLGWALRQRRGAMPGVRSREQLAERLGYSVAVIKDVENGVYRAGLHRFLTRWEQVIGLDSELQALWDQTRAERTAWRERSAQAARNAHLDVPDNDLGQDLDWADAGMVSDFDHWEFADILTRSSISRTALDHMERAVYGYAARYPSSSPSELMPAVTALLRRLHGVLAQPQSLAVRRHAVQLIGTLSGTKGNLSLDLGRDYDAAESFAVGKLAGTEAEDQDLTAWVLATESIGPFLSGRYHHAVQLLEEAMQRTTHRCSARRRAWIAAFQARGYAALGAAGRAFTALDEAYAALGHAEAPRSTDFFDAARLEGVAGTSYLLLRDTARAGPTLAAALEQRVPGDAKGRALLTLDLAACRLLEDEGDESCRLVEEALDLAQGSIVEPIVTRARTVRASLGRSAGRDTLARVDLRLAELQR